jgi:hypothetical protein
MALVRELIGELRELRAELRAHRDKAGA